VVSVDSNSRTLLDAKRDGLSCVAVKGLAANAQSLRSADKVVDSLAALRAKDLYHVSLNATVPHHSSRSSRFLTGVVRCGV
jgi:hypothetical protein